MKNIDIPLKSKSHFKKNKVIYKVNCKNCSSHTWDKFNNTYKNTVNTVKLSVKNKTDLAALAKQTFYFGHSFDFDHITI